MNPATETQLRRRPDSTSAAAQARNQLLVAELPELFKMLGKQNQTIHQAIKEQTVIMQNQLTISTNERDWVERMNERFDALSTETRVTNLLLSELVAIHKSVITAPIDESREAIRHDAYARVLNGE